MYIYMFIRGRARAGARPLARRAPARQAPVRYPPLGVRRQAGAVTRPFFAPDNKGRNKLNQ